jgi:hypothetical protein
VEYRGFSAFIASDNDFPLFWCFDAINARFLVYLEDKIAVLEEELEGLDTIHSKEEAQDIHNRSFRQEALPGRTALLEELDVLVKRCSKSFINWQSPQHAHRADELLIQHSTIRTQPRVAKRNVESISNWLFNTQNTILDKEAAYIQKRSDLVQLVPKAITPFQHLLEKSTRFRLSRLWVKKQPDLPIHSAAYPDTLHYRSDARVDRSVGVTVMVLGLAMLIAPLWVLAYTEVMWKRLGVMTGFIVLFLGRVAFTTIAKPFQESGGCSGLSGGSGSVLANWCWGELEWCVMRKKDYHDSWASAKRANKPSWIAWRYHQIGQRLRIRCKSYLTVDTP